MTGGRRRPFGTHGRTLPPPTWTLTWLVQAAHATDLLDAAVARDTVQRAGEQRARLHAARAAQPEGHVAVVGPVELLASFGLRCSDGAPLDEPRLAQLVAEVAGLPCVVLDPLKLDMQLVTQTVSAPFARRHVVLPLWVSADGLVVAVENPFDEELLAGLQSICKQRILPRVAAGRDILRCISEIYGFMRSVESAAAESLGDAASTSGRLALPGALDELLQLPSSGVVEADDHHVVNAVNHLFTYAFAQRASDIHIEPRARYTQVRLRIDGMLHDTHRVPKRVHAAVASRIKMLARLDVAERRRPQDGRIRTQLGSRAVDMRVSTMPQASGEKLVLRLLEAPGPDDNLEGLHMAPQALAIFRSWLLAPHGLVLLTGPTGSGKTTTLYAAMGLLAGRRVNVTSIEDPIEILHERFNQVAVNVRVGLDFAQALRHVLRQDPDVIMVGEIRDASCAHMAVQAALTGHLVLSTLHTNDSVGAILRLQHMGIAPFLVAAVLRGVMAQRLLRTLCGACAVPDPQGAATMEALTGQPWRGEAAAGLRRGVGCPACRGTGYVGRHGVFELCHMDEALRAGVLAGASQAELMALAERRGTVPLTLAAAAHVRCGTSSVADYVRVMGAGPSVAGHDVVAARVPPAPPGPRCAI